MAGQYKKLAESSKYADLSTVEKLTSRLHRAYPFENLRDLYTKTTVSELKIAAMSGKDEAAYHKFEENEIVPYIPTFQREKEKVPGTVRGNAYHRAMELLDFDGILSRQFDGLPDTYEAYRKGLDSGGLYDPVKDFLGEMKDSLRLSEEYYEIIRIDKLIHFMESRVAFRMWCAQRNGTLYREQPFVLGISASQLDDKFPAEEKVLIQGIIDVFFIEGDELVLLDYKTDIIDDLPALWNRYGVQMDYYQRALEQLMGKKVKSRVLYSFYLEKEDWRA